MTIQEIMARIAYDVDRLRYSGMYEREMAILLTRELFTEISLHYIETVPEDDANTKMFGIPVRIVTGEGREWFVSAAHGIAPKEGD